MTGKQSKPKIALAVYRCAQCGDTFPAPEEGPVRCPSCGSDVTEHASEPLL